MQRVKQKSPIGGIMESICTKSTTGGEHRLEFKASSDNETEWVCLDCGEPITQYHNAGC